jgi:hypothetical protein
MTDQTKATRPTLVLALSLPRTGTSSMCEALTPLGYQNVYELDMEMEVLTEMAPRIAALEEIHRQRSYMTSYFLNIRDWLYLKKEL